MFTSRNLGRVCRKKNKKYSKNENEIVFQNGILVNYSIMH